MINDTQRIAKLIKRNPAGGVVADERGRSVWQWEDGQGSTSIVRRRLENSALELEPTQKAQRLARVPQQRSIAGDPAAQPSKQPVRTLSLELVDGDSPTGGGFDPYNRR